MRKLLLLSFAITFAGCSGDQASNQPPAADPVSTTASNGDVVEAVSPNSVPVPDTTPEPSAKLPFDMPIMPGARYKSGMDFSKPTKRRGPEAIATIIANGTPLDVVEFYEKALRENGFTPTLGVHNDESSAKVSGVRENGETFSVTSMRGGSKAGAGKCQTAIVATKPKPEEDE